MSLQWLRLLLWLVFKPWPQELPHAVDMAPPKKKLAKVIDVQGQKFKQEQGVRVQLSPCLHLPVISLVSPGIATTPWLL